MKLDILPTAILLTIHASFQIAAATSSVNSKLLKTNDILHSNNLAGKSTLNDRLTPVILLPGDGGSRLQARLNRTDVLHHYCERRADDWFDLWCNLSLLVPFAIECWVENMKLVYNPKSRRTSDSPGVTTRVQGFGSCESVEYVAPSKVYGTGYFDAIVRQLVTYGYERNKNIFGAPYDFRRAPNEQPDFFTNLELLVTKAYKDNGNEPVSFICHSMGCLFGLHFLKEMPQIWKDKYIRSMISLAGPYGGSVKALKAFASGDNFGVIVVPSLSLRKDIRTFPSLAYLLPTEDVWPNNQVLVQNRDKNYTVHDYKQFFADIQYPTGYEMWSDVHNLTPITKAPGVEVHCLHGNKVSTPETIHYEVGKFPDAKPRITYGDGDGTVNLLSLESCYVWKTLQKQPFYYKNFSSIDHMSILSDEQVMNYIGDVLSKK